MSLRCHKTLAVLALLLLSLAPSTAPAAQGQWGGFIYLFPKSGVELTEEWKRDLAALTEQAAQSFTNDFLPAQSGPENILYIKTVRYTMSGKPLAPQPLGVIRVESMDRGKIDGFYQAFRNAAEHRLDLKIIYGVTSELRYTDAATLERLKQNAPQRGSGFEQPNAVVFPLSKSQAWWGLPLDQRQAYFFQHPERFGAAHEGHNEIGFRYIQKIFRKLYQSRFIDGESDFVTYFEYADRDREVFTSLLEGLRDTERNPEWKFVEEAPIVYGTRVQGLVELLKD
ncbi:chlorite dismutase family protein [Nitrospina gracilis]|uniref:chlorite dismutase family protein n=1 Tax=Nitrospina gracilis TaxID=35801 RepID=UPI001EFFE05F|nr:chlorite dismutase family protein [Nitrospina gracilis]MCF8721821.1 chlorite dismutase [Nitrospina gracilis Nb-211]